MCGKESPSRWCINHPKVYKTTMFSYLLYRAWRGMVGRCIAAYFLMLAKQLRIPKPKSPPSRFKAEVFRRIWARKAFVPEGGWPGKADFKEFDMWDHIYTPPKGNKYGLKTHKVSLDCHNKSYFCRSGISWKKKIKN